MAFMVHQAGDAIPTEMIIAVVQVFAVVAKLYKGS